ncbi:hypothetical protein BH23BAC1_BH23BAC1_23910 [soil metagenome]
MRTSIIIAYLFFVFRLGQAQSTLMPLGDAFDFWDDQTKYSKTYHVSHLHPEASDQNPGTREKPFLTIGKAAAVLQPGEKVVIGTGTYRESVRLARGGTSPKKMIAYEAAPGARVLVKGTRSDKLSWTRSNDPAGQNFSLKIWSAALPQEWFDGEINPFKTLNASSEDIALMDWAKGWDGRVPYTLRRGLIFQDGKRLMQLATFEDLVRLPGSFWVDETGEKVYLHPFEGKDPHQAFLEITAHQHLFKPVNPGTSFIRISGLQFAQAGNGFPRVGVGAVFVFGGDHWIIENTTVSQVNSVGIEIGARIKEVQASTKEENQKAKDHAGNFIVRNNTIYDCGTGGLQGHTLRNSLVENNHIYNIGWQDVETYWESAAIKLLINEKTLLRNNHIHDVEAACAIWLDWDNKNSRITGNLIHDIGPTYGGAVYIEASQHPNMIDNNILWKVEGIGISLKDTDETIVAHNLIAHTDQPLVSQVNTTRKLNGRPLSSTNNKILNNIFFASRDLPVVKDQSNIFDQNIWAGSKAESLFASWKNQGWERKGAFVQLDISPMEGMGELSFSLDQPLQLVEPVKWVNSDFFGQLRPAGQTAIGPFSGKVKGQHMWQTQKGMFK